MVPAAQHIGWVVGGLDALACLLQQRGRGGGGDDDALACLVQQRGSWGKGKGREERRENMLQRFDV